MYVKRHWYIGWDELKEVARQRVSTVANLYIIFVIALATAVFTPRQFGIIGYVFVALGVSGIAAMVFLLALLPAIDRYHAEIEADVRYQEQALLATIAASTQELLRREDLDGTEADDDWVVTADAGGGDAGRGTQ